MAHLKKSSEIDVSPSLVIFRRYCIKVYDWLWFSGSILPSSAFSLQTYAVWLHFNRLLTLTCNYRQERINFFSHMHGEAVFLDFCPARLVMGDYG